jgi:hypothetical protein
LFKRPLEHIVLPALRPDMSGSAGVVTLPLISMTKTSAIFLFYASYFDVEIKGEG